MSATHCTAYFCLCIAATLAIQVNADQFDITAKSFRDAFKGKDPPTPGEQHTPLRRNTGFSTSGLPSDVLALKARLSDDIAGLYDTIPSYDLVVVVDARGVILRAAGYLFFSPGIAVIDSKALKILNIIAKALHPSTLRLTIEGHTDNQLGMLSEYESNLELSADRASNLRLYFVKQAHIDACRVSAVGYGGMRPLLNNSSDANRARNRRIEFVFAKPAYNCALLPD